MMDRSGMSKLPHLTVAGTIEDEIKHDLSEFALDRLICCLDSSAVDGARHQGIHDAALRIV